MMPPPVYGPWNKGFWDKAPTYLKGYWATLIAALPFIATSALGYGTWAGDFGRSLWIGCLIGFGGLWVLWYGFIAYRCVKLVAQSHPALPSVASHLQDNPYGRVNGIVLLTLRNKDDGAVYAEVATFNVKHESISSILNDALKADQKTQ